MGIAAALERRGLVRCNAAVDVDVAHVAGECHGRSSCMCRLLDEFVVDVDAVDDEAVVCRAGSKRLCCRENRYHTVESPPCCCC